MGRDHDDARESWFEKPPAYSVPPPSSIPAPRGKARPGAAALWGAVVGAAASVPCLLVASLLGRQLGKWPEPLAAGVRSYVVTALMGAVIGLLLGLAMTHSLRLRARLIFAPIVSLTLYLLVHVLVLRAHPLSLPLIPMLAGVAVYGICVGFAPPFDRRPR
jgi:hypothetical protein